MSGLTPKKKEKLKELMGSCSSPISWSLVSLEERYKMISIEDFETNRVYRHFKGNYYYVMDIAEHTETNELMVVYHALYSDYECYVRPFAMFVEELDDVTKLLYKQEYRFVPVAMSK